MGNETLPNSEKNVIEICLEDPFVHQPRVRSEHRVHTSVHASRGPSPKTFRRRLGRFSILLIPGMTTLPADPFGTVPASI